MLSKLHIAIVTSSLMLMAIFAGCLAPIQLLPISQTSPTPMTSASQPEANLCPQQSPAPSGLRAKPGYLEFEASDVDGSGAPITGLQQSDFVVCEGSRKCPIAYFHENTTSSHASVFIVLDASGTMLPKMVTKSVTSDAKVRSALTKGIDGLGRCDEIGLAVTGGRYAPGFRPAEMGIPPALSEATILTPFTTDHSKVVSRLEMVVPSGPSHLADALKLGVDQLNGAYYPERALIIITDGIDSPAIGESEGNLQHRNLAGIRVIIIGIGHGYASGPGTGSFPHSPERSADLDLNEVRELAASGSGQVLLAKPVDDDDGASLAQAFSAIGKQLDHSYTIGAVAPAAGHPSLSLANSRGGTLYADLIPTWLPTIPPSSPPPDAQAKCAQVSTPEAITSKPGYTQLRISVVDADGHLVHALKQADFLVTSDSKSLPVVYAHEDPEGIPTSVMVVMDSSLSMWGRLEGARSEVGKLIMELNPCDDVGLLTFGERPVLVQPLTTDHYMVARRLASLNVSGRSALYSALNTSADLLAKGNHPNRAIILVSDGVDNASGKSMSDVLKTLANNQVQVDAVGIGIPFPFATKVLIPLGLPAPGPVADEGVLGELVARTGGVGYIVPVNDEDKTGLLSSAVRKLGEAIGPGYDIGFTAPSGKLQMPAISVINHPDYKVGISEVPLGSSLVHLQVRTPAIKRDPGHT
jgi:VWFA-related protein